jgi:hypothetical protein
MANIEANWRFPQYSPYSVLNVLCPAISWTENINHPLIKEFKVQLFRREENRYVDLGVTQETYIAIPSDDYDIYSSYQIRIATMSADGRQSAWTEGQSFVASPLRFDFSSSDTAKLPEGRVVNTQRLLFLLF